MVYRADTPPDEGDIETGTRVCTKCRQRQSMQNFGWTGKPHKYRKHACKTCAYVPGSVVSSGGSSHGVDAAMGRTYGVTAAAILKLKEDQNFECAICHAALDSRAHVDHDHGTGKVRGILCFTCNTGLGKFRDNVEYLRSAVTYLERTPPDLEAWRAPTAEERTAERSERVKRSWETRRRNSVQMKANGV